MKYCTEIEKYENTEIEANECQKIFYAIIEYINQNFSDDQRLIEILDIYSRKDNNIEKIISFCLLILSEYSKINSKIYSFIYKFLFYEFAKVYEKNFEEKNLKENDLYDFYSLLIITIREEPKKSKSPIYFFNSFFFREYEEQKFFYTYFNANITTDEIIRDFLKKNEKEKFKECLECLEKYKHLNHEDYKIIIDEIFLSIIYYYNDFSKYEDFLINIFSNYEKKEKYLLYWKTRKAFPNDIVKVKFNQNQNEYFMYFKGNYKINDEILDFIPITNTLIDFNNSSFEYKKFTDGNLENIKLGYREDLKCGFRSSWEANFARILNYHNIEWKYELKNFELIFNKYKTLYVPDFFLKNNLLIEIKGFWDERSKFKVKAFKQNYKDIKLFCIDKDIYYLLNKRYSTLIKNWENENVSLQYGLCNVVGMKYHNPQEFMNTLNVGEELYYKREFDNKYDSNAIKIYSKNNVFIGYISAENACILADKIDLGIEYKFTVIDIKENCIKLKYKIINLDNIDINKIINLFKGE